MVYLRQKAIRMKNKIESALVLLPLLGCVVLWRTLVVATVEVLVVCDRLMCHVVIYKTFFGSYKD